MTDAEILELIRRALHEIEPDRDAAWADVQLDARIEDLELDSIRTMEMVNFLEEEADVMLPEEQLPEVETLRQLADLVKQELA